LKDEIQQVWESSHDEARVAKIVSKSLLETCHNIYRDVFADYGTEKMKKLAKENVGRMNDDTAGMDSQSFVSTSLVYGEVEFFSFINILERASPQKGEKFYDLGHGTGKALVAAGLLFGDIFSKIAGVEILTDLHNISINTLDLFKKSLQKSPELFSLFLSHQQCDMGAIHGDILSEAVVAEWTSCDIVFTNSTCFDDALMQRIAEVAIGMRQGSRFISLTRPLPSVEFEIVDKVNLGMSWGLATCFIHVRR
jgi:SAM-dependent methyltransferase